MPLQTSAACVATVKMRPGQYLEVRGFLPLLTAFSDLSIPEDLSTWSLLRSATAIVLILESARYRRCLFGDRESRSGELGRFVKREWSDGRTRTEVTS